MHAAASRKNSRIIGITDTRELMPCEKDGKKILFKKNPGKIRKRPFRELRPDRTAGKPLGNGGAADAERND